MLWTCNGRANERWFIAGFGQLVNPRSHKCLTGSASGTNGAQVWIHTCNGHRNQAWTLPASPVQSGVAGKCLNLRRNKTWNGNKIQIWTCEGYVRQRWVVKRNGTVRIHGKCLDVAGKSMLDGAAIDLWKCTSGRRASQTWLVGPGGELINAHSGKCLADPRNSATNGTVLRQEDCYGDAGEIWALT